MADRIVLVHSPLVAPATWDALAPVLISRGREVSMPDLTATVAAGPPYLARQARLVADAAPGQAAVLVGHSGAGSLLAQAASIAGGVAGLVYVDAGLPTPGRNWLETAPAELAAQLRQMAGPDGWLPPWPRWFGEEEMAALVPDPRAREHFAASCPRLPMAMFEERHPAAPGWQEAPSAYLRLSEAYDDDAARARALGWPVAERDSHHLAMLTDPGAVADSLLGLLSRLEASAA